MVRGKGWLVWLTVGEEIKLEKEHVSVEKGRYQKTNDAHYRSQTEDSIHHCHWINWIIRWFALSCGKQRRRKWRRNRKKQNLIRRFENGGAEALSTLRKRAPWHLSFIGHILYSVGWAYKCFKALLTTSRIVGGGGRVGDGGNFRIDWVLQYNLAYNAME